MNRVNQLVWHYTNTEGLLGILESNTLWATAANMLNDSSELHHGIKLAREIWASESSEILTAAKNEAEEQGMQPPNEDTVQQYLPATIDEVEREISENSVFVACASLDPDLLNQWRGYGGAQGYAIGIDKGPELGVLQKMGPAGRSGRSWPCPGGRKSSISSKIR